MNFMLPKPGGLALAAACAAVCAGCLLLLLSGAPARMPIMNFAALLIGLASLFAMRSAAALVSRRKLADLAFLSASLLVPLTALVGAPTEGVARWLIVGGVSLQPALMVVPPLAVGFALRPNAMRAAAVMLAAFGLALQPDPAAAAMLAAGSAAAFLGRGNFGVAIVAVLVATLGCAAAVATATPLPPIPFVEHVLPTAFRSGPAASLTAAAGTALLFLPLLVLRHCPAQTRAAFGGVWLAAIASALLGPYPTPVIGFGGSAIVGYLLSVGLIDPDFLARSAAPQSSAGRKPGDSSGGNLRLSGNAARNPI